MRYWTIVYPMEHSTLGYDIAKWETLSDKEILDEYWEYWSTQMKRVGKDYMISEERCIEDWCVVHWAERNYWREMKEQYE